MFHFNPPVPGQIPALRIALSFLCVTVSIDESVVDTSVGSQPFDSRATSPTGDSTDDSINLDGSSSEHSRVLGQETVERGSRDTEMAGRLTLVALGDLESIPYLV